MRPRFHFTPERGWMNDPCGLVRLGDGRWRIHFQHAPAPPALTWGAAESEDLLRWSELGTALPADADGWAYSGSALEDRKGAAGFGAGALLAFHTRHDAQQRRQRQALAVSTDAGAMWRSAGIFLDEGQADSRDPFVFAWGGSWRMLLARPVAWSAPGEGRSTVAVYASDDLRHWRELGELGVEGSPCELLECPALLPGLSMGDGPERRDLLLAGAVARDGARGISRTDAWIGHFDGARFEVEAGPLPFDHGPDFYAPAPFAGLARGEAVVAGWANNWDYARALGFGAWGGGSLTLPRRVRLRRDNRDTAALAQEPAANPRDALPGTRRRWSGIVEGELLLEESVHAFDMRIASGLEREGAGVRLETVDGSAATITRVAEGLAVDRDGLAAAAHFGGRWTVPAGDGALHLVFDAHLIELFTNEGAALTAILWPPGPRRLSLTAPAATRFELELWTTP